MEKTELSYANGMFKNKEKHIKQGEDIFKEYY